MTDARHAAERAARDGYGQLLAYLSLRCRDVAAVEDALSQAFVHALERWPLDGIPDKPVAWLLTVARRRLIDLKRSKSSQAVSLSLDDLPEKTSDLQSPIPDERLKLLFVCTHPAIDPWIQTPLMLQTVLGLDAATIAKSFLVSPSTMSQRLVRAKTRIRDLEIPFAVPDLNELPARLDTVLSAIYAAYGSAWEDRLYDLSNEAIHLGGLLLTLLPNEPEVYGLMAMMLHCEARRDARFDHENRYVPLDQQDVSRWSSEKIIQAEKHLWQASSHRRTGHFQLLAAIQSAHNRRCFGGVTPTSDIVMLYQELIRVHDSVGARVAYAGALGQANRVKDGLAVLESNSPDLVQDYQSYWVVKSHLLTRSGREEEANVCLERALELTTDASIRDHLQKKIKPV